MKMPWYRCAYSGCGECFEAFDMSGSAEACLGQLMDAEWLCTAKTIDGVVISLFFCPKHYREGMIVNNA